jgi:hypothetical protein
LTFFLLHHNFIADSDYNSLFLVSIKPLFSLYRQFTTQMKTLLSIGSIAVASLALNLTPVQPAQAVNLVSNGDFNLNNVAAGTSGYTGGGTNVASATDWSFGSGLNWLVSTGTAYTDNLNIKQGRPDSTQQLYGTAAINSPNGTANWFVVADGDTNFRSSITQTLSGLVAGEKYDVSFWQGAAQQRTFNGGTTEQWRVSLGGSPNQFSELMSPIQSTGRPGLDADGGGTAIGVYSWQKQTLRFTAGSTNQTLRFLAIGAPTGQPPLSLLTGVSVEAVTVPEPFTILGTMTAVGFGMRLRSKLKHKK